MDGEQIYAHLVAILGDGVGELLDPDEEHNAELAAITESAIRGIAAARAAGDRDTEEAAKRRMALAAQRVLTRANAARFELAGLLFDVAFEALDAFAGEGLRRLVEHLRGGADARP